MDRVLVGLLALVLTACAGSGAEPQPNVEPSSSPAAATSTPTKTSAPRLAPPKVRYAKAVAALRRSDPLEYSYLLSDSGGALIHSIGSWDPETGSASLDILFSGNPAKPAETRVGGNLILVGDLWYSELRNHCWIRADRDVLAVRYGLTEDTLGVTAADALPEAQVTGVSPSSADVIEVDFELNRVLAMMGLPDIDPKGKRVPGQVTVLRGRVEKWTIEGADLADSLAQGVSSQRAKALSYLELEMELFHGPTDVIRRPSRDELAPDSRTPCQAAAKRQV